MSLSELWLVHVFASWLMMKWVERRAASRDGLRLKRQKETETQRRQRHRGDTENKRRLLFLHHYSKTPFFLHRLIFSFLLFALPLSCLFFLLFIPFLVSIISFYLSISAVFCCSDTQTNEPWNIRHQDTKELVCAKCVWGVCYICVWVEEGGGGWRRPYTGVFWSHFAFGFEVCEVSSALWKVAHLRPIPSSVIRENVGNQIDCWNFPPYSRPAEEQAMFHQGLSQISQQPDDRLQA